LIIGTKLKILGGKWQPIETIKVGDVLELAGKVLSIRQKTIGIVYKYKGELLREHQVILEGKRWIKVEKSKLAEKMPQISCIPFFEIVTENHKLMCRKFLATDSGV
jgi:hypothetical protein